MISRAHAIAPRGLCPRCAFAMALRVDALHQCSSASPPYAAEELLGGQGGERDGAEDVDLGRAII